MNAKEVISNILEEKGTIKQVYWVACGGSVIDLYPAHFMVNAESSTIESGCYTAKEFVLYPPKKLGKDSLVIVCSHSGNTPEAVEGAQLSYERGAKVITLTDQSGSKCDDERYISWIYPWGDGVKTSEVPSGITLLLMAELLKAQEGFDKYDAIVKGVDQMDAIIEAAKVKVNAELGDAFAKVCQKHDFFYILGSGPTFSQTYGCLLYTSRCV